MSDEKERNAEQLPTEREWIAGGARNPDDFEIDEDDTKQEKTKRKPD